MILTRKSEISTHLEMKQLYRHLYTGMWRFNLAFLKRKITFRLFTEHKMEFSGLFGVCPPVDPHLLYALLGTRHVYPQSECREAVSFLNSVLGCAKTRRLLRTSHYDSKCNYALHEVYEFCLKNIGLLNILTAFLISHIPSQNPGLKV